MSPLLTQRSFGSPGQSNQRRKRNKRDPDWKRSKYHVTVCRWHDSIHRKTYRGHFQLLELINECGKAARYQINTQTPLASLDGNNKISERGIKERIPFTITTKRISRKIYLRRQKTWTQKAEYTEGRNHRWYKQTERHTVF